MPLLRKQLAIIFVLYLFIYSYLSQLQFLGNEYEAAYRDQVKIQIVLWLLDFLQGLLDYLYSLKSLRRSLT